MPQGACKSGDGPDMLVVDVSLEDPGWDEALPGAVDLAESAVRGAFAKISARAGINGPAELSVVLLGDARQRMLNRDFRGKDTPTNVLSFPASPPQGSPALPEGAPLLLGDITIALETTQSEAREQEKSLANHFCHLLVHGMLHLAGLDHVDEADAREMENLEREILADMGIGDPYA